MLWNYGEKTELTSIVKETAKIITVNLEGWVRIFNKTRLIAIGCAS